MIGELRLKVDGMQKELHTQNQRLEEGARFAEHFHNDLRVAVQVRSHVQLVILCVVLYDSPVIYVIVSSLVCRTTEYFQAPQCYGDQDVQYWAASST